MARKSNSRLTKLTIAAGVVVAGLGGGYVYLTGKITDAVETAFREFPAQNEVLTTLNHGGLDINLFANRVTLSNVTAQMKVRVRPDIPEMTSNISYDTVSIDGVMALAFGGQTIQRIEMLNGVMSMTMDATDTTPDLSATLKMPWGMAEGYDFSNAFDGTKLKPTWYQHVAYTAFDAKDMSGEVIITPPKEQPGNPLNTIFDLARMRGQDVSMQRVGEIKVEGFTLKFVGPDGENISMGVEDLLYRNVVMMSGIAISAESEINGLTFDPGNMAGQETAAIMQNLGIENFRLSTASKYAYDVDARTIAMTLNHLTLDGFGSVAMDLELSALPPRALMEKVMAMAQQMQTDGFQNAEPSLTPQLQAEFEQALTKVAIDRIKLGYTDLGIVRKQLDVIASENNADLSMIADALAQQGAAIVAASHGPEKAQEVMPQLVAFLSNPGALSVELKSAIPVVAMDLAAAFEMQGPQALSVLDLTVTGTGAQ